MGAPRHAVMRACLNGCGGWVAVLWQGRWVGSRVSSVLASPCLVVCARQGNDSRAVADVLVLLMSGRSVDILFAPIVVNPRVQSINS